MAKWGEGDPRWIVEERPDATNVNNWHWAEKNACQWSIDTLKSLLTGLKIETKAAVCILTEVESCEGEAVVNNRKGKLIFLYEWDINIKWDGRLNGHDKTTEGFIHIPNLGDENSIAEVEVAISVKESNEDTPLLKEIMNREGRDIIKKKLQEYVTKLKEEFSKGLILPKKNDTECNDMMNKLTIDLNNQVPGIVENKKPASVAGCKIETGTIKMHHKFQCTGPELYNVLTKEELVTSFTKNPVKLDVRKGGKFELFGGNIEGSFQELIPGEKIKQTWRTKSWPAGHYSNVVIDVVQKSDCTELTLVQTLVPRSEIEKTKENWDRYYWDSIKRTFGFGSFIL